MTETSHQVGIDDIRKAAETMAGVIVDTPSLHSRTLSALTGAEIYLKMENLQFTASFKDRGSLVKLNALDEEQRRHGVVANSAGNHAQGVAYHAGRLGIPATIVMPKGTPFTKVRSTELLGARVELHGSNLSEAGERARELVERDGLTFVHPYDDPLIVAGQGTVGLEIADQMPEIDDLVVPIGGGGLMAGVAIAMRALRPEVRLTGVEIDSYPTMHAAIRGGRPLPDRPTIAEGIAVKQPGALTRPIIADLVDEFLIVDEATTERAVQLFIEIEKTVVEGAAATTLAALLANRERFGGRKVGLIVTGGNIDSNLLASVLLRGLVRDGRLIRLRVQIPDVPGGLAAITALIADLGANVIEVQHNRLFYDVPVKLTDVDFALETRDREHVARILEGLKTAGFDAEILQSTARDPSEGY